MYLTENVDILFPVKSFPKFLLVVSRDVPKRLVIVAF